MILNQRTAQFRWTPILFVAMLTFSGCGSSSGIPLSDVSGVVTMEGVPAKGAGIRFSPKSGQRASSGQVGEDGKYRLIFTPDELGAVIGEHEVLVQYQGELFAKGAVVVEEASTSTIDFELAEFDKK